MAVMSYGISDTLQDKYTSPQKLKEESILKFHTTTLWDAVLFPEWGGNRVEHDPTYTAYTSFEIPEDTGEDDSGPCGASAIILVAAMASVCVVGYNRRCRH